MEGPSFNEFKSTVKSFQELWQFNNPDDPSLVSVKDEHDRIFLSLWIEDDGSSDFYLYARMDVVQYTKLIKKEITHKDILKNSLDGFIYVVSISESGDVGVDTVDCEDVDDELLS